MEHMLLFVLLALALALPFYAKRKRYVLPPGPKGLPFVGNVRDLPRGFEWLAYAKWSRDVASDVIYLNILGTPIVILNSLTAAKDLLERRSSIYSDRKEMVMLNDLVGWERNFGFLQYGEKWREHRRVFHLHFHPNAVPKYRENFSKEAKLLLRRLLEDPDAFLQQFRTLAGSTILRISFGIDVKSGDDPYITLAEKGTHSMAAVANAGAYLVDYFPLLKYLPTWAPGARFRRDAAEWKKSVVGMYEKPFQFVKESVTSGKAESSISATLLANMDDMRDILEQEDVIRHVGGTAYCGGSDTTAAALGTFVLAMLLSPEAQRAAQAQISRVVGRDRLPSYEDKKSLTYVTAILQETLRWHPVTPLITPHRLMVDDEYKGYRIPAGSMVVANAWAILHDEERFPNPETFDPTRFLTADGELCKDAPDVQSAFGFGRRICPGRHFAMESLWITIAHILAAFIIEKPIDQRGNVVEPSEEYTSGLICHSLPFKANFKPRDESVVALIETSPPHASD